MGVHLKSYFLNFTNLRKKPNWFLLFTFKFLDLFTFRKFEKVGALRRLLTSARLPIEPTGLNFSNLPEIEILFICAGKDLEILPAALMGAVNSIGEHPLLQVTLIVPPQDLKNASEIANSVSPKIQVISEESVLSKSEISRIRNVFDSRAGWVIQQLLKVIYVSQSSSPGILVCDADTVLTRPRTWVDDSRTQILLPSWELTKPYYEFLNSLGLGKINPKHTFVSHHMLMQPIYMIEARKFVGWESNERILDSLINTYDGRNPSPFSIDFELYAQFLCQQYPEKVKLVKWANVSLTRKEWENFSKYSSKYASVSLHAYLN